MLRKWINDLAMILLALVLAVVVWIVAVQEENPIEEGIFAESIPVKVLNQPAGTTFLPSRFDETVQLTVRAPSSSLRDLRADKFTVWIDIAGRGPGNYELAVQASCTDPNVTILSLQPATVPVRLKKEISREVPVQVHLFGTAALGFELKTGEEDVIIESEFVTITGPEDLVEQVTKVTVDVYFQDAKQPVIVEQAAIARDANDDMVGFVDLEPSTVRVTVPVVQKTGFKEVVVLSDLSGSVAAGYSVQSVIVDPVNVMLVGDPDVVSKISGFVRTESLDISGATGDVVERLPLDLPEGVSTAGVQGVLVTVSVMAQQGRLTVVRQPIMRGLVTDLQAQVSPEMVEVALFGPLPRLNSITDEDVLVYVELVDKGIGTHVVDLTYLVPEGLEVISIVPESVEVEISRIPPTPTLTPTVTRTPTVTPTPTLTPTPTATPTGMLTGTATISATPGITVTITPAGTVVADAQSTPVPSDGTPTAVPTPLTPTPIATPAKEQ